MKAQSAVLAMAMVVAMGMIAGACTASSENPPGSGGSSSSSGSGGNKASSGGSSGSGNSSGTGGSSGGGSCPSVSACGGDVVGAWSVMSSCLNLGGELDVGLAGLDPRTCSHVKISGTLNVTGKWSASGDTTYTDDTATTGDVKLELPAGCLMLSGTTTTCSGVTGPLKGGIGFTTLDCSDASGGGCTCTGTVDQKGSIGQITADPQKTGNHAKSGNTLTLDGVADYSYCVSGGKLTLTPVSMKFKVDGTIVLEGGSSSSGSGGMMASGGKTGSASGGMSGSASGGMTGSASGGSSQGGAVGSGGRGGAAPGSGGGTPSGGSMGTGNRGDGPCDIYKMANTPCGAAYSTIRGLSKSYTGPLYQVRNGSSAMNTGMGGMTKDIGMTADGFADTATQDSFCMGSVCTFAILYDQSGNGNDLKSAPGGLSNGGSTAASPDFESSATKGMLMVGGHKVYSVYMNTREGYRTPLNFKAKGVPMGNTAQGIYELADGTHTGSACCWDFGSVSPDPKQYVTMNTLFFGTATFWGTGAGNGPWFMGDFEGGVWAGGSGGSNTKNNMNPSLGVKFAMGVLHTPVGKYALRMADTATASDLTTAYDGAIPSGKTWGNAGGIVLGVGGDNSNNSAGTFYEGAVTNGSPSNDTDLAVMKNIQAAGYGK